MPRKYLKEGDQVLATGAQIYYEGVGKWSVWDIAAHGEIFFNGLPVSFDEKDRPYVDVGKYDVGAIKGGRSMKKKHKIHPVREQILDIAEDVSANPGSALLTVGIFAALGVGGFILVKKIIAKRKATEAPKEEPVPPSVTPVIPQPMAGNQTLNVGASYMIAGQGVNVRKGPGVTFSIDRTLSAGNFIVKNAQADSAGNIWGNIWSRKFISQGNYSADKNIGWVFSGYLRVITF